MRISDWSSDVCSSDLEGGSDVASTNRRAGDRYLERSRQERRRRERPPPLGAPPHRSPASVAAQQPGELALNANPHRRITLRLMIAIGRIEADHRAFPPEVFERGFLVFEIGRAAGRERVCAYG